MECERQLRHAESRRQVAIGELRRFWYGLDDDEQEAVLAAAPAAHVDFLRAHHITEPEDE